MNLVPKIEGEKKKLDINDYKNSRVDVVQCGPVLFFGLRDQSSFGLYHWVKFDNELWDTHKNKVIYHANKSSASEPRAPRCCQTAIILM